MSHTLQTKSTANRTASLITFVGIHINRCKDRAFCQRKTYLT